MRSLNRKFLPAIDHLRALAAVYVLLFHGTQRFYAWTHGEPTFKFDWWFETQNPIWALLYEGHTAVTLFIVLSGFVLSIGLTKISFAEFKVGKYLLNRSLRIYPLFLFVIAMGLLAFPERWSLSSALTLVFLGKVPGAMNLEHFTAVTWSVVVEDHCYLLFPVIAWIMTRGRIPYALALILGLLALRLALNVSAGPSFMLNYGSVIGRIDQFAIGSFAAVFIYQARPLPVIYPLASGALVIAYVYVFHIFGPFPNMAPWRAISPTIEAIIWTTFILSYVGFVGNVRNALSSVLEKLGLISYSIYLMHIPIVHFLGVNGILLNIAQDPVTNAFLNSLFLLLPMTLIVSTATYYVVERPFLKLRKRYLAPKPSPKKSMVIEDGRSVKPPCLQRLTSD